MKRLIGSLSIAGRWIVRYATLLLVLFLGGQTYFFQGRIRTISSELSRTSASLDSLLAQRNKTWVPDPAWDYTWFNLGVDAHQIVGGFYYVSSIKITYQGNGFRVAGTIANLGALGRYYVEVRCAVKDPSLVGGFSLWTDRG